MVYLDYELGESTRIEENRLSIFPYSQRRRNAFGGPVGYFFCYSTFAFGFFYFYRKFNNYSTFKRILGSGFLAIGLFEEASLLSLSNMGDVQEYIYLNERPFEKIEQFYLEQEFQKSKSDIRHEQNREKAQRELGKV